MWNYIRKWLKYRPEPAEFIREQTQGHEWKIIGAGKKLGFYESVILGLIMASDNLGISSFFGLINPLHRYYAFSGLFLALLTGIFSFLAVGLGQLSGDETRRRFLQMPQAVFFLELMGSALIILLGLYDPAGVIVEAAIPH